MTKKILLIIGILAIIGVVAFLIFSPQQQNGDGGESRVGFSIMNYFPFGGGDDGDDDTGTTGTTTNIATTSSTTTFVAQPVPRLRKISSEPVAGAAIWNIGTTSIVRFVEKGTGNVYEARSDTVNIQRLTNTTIPKIVRAFWLPNGSGFLAQTLISDSEIIETNFVRLNKNKTSSTTEDLTPFSTTIGKLPTGIKEISMKPDGSKIFYYTINGSYSNWFVSNPDGTNATSVLQSPLTEWLPKWISGNILMMQTKSSSENLGFIYSFDVGSKLFKKTGIGMLGISSNPNKDGSLNLVSSGKSFPALYLIDNKSVSTTKITSNTLAEKCVWLNPSSGKGNPTVYCAVPNQIPKGKYPDDWYKGIISTEDSIIKIDINNDIFYNIADLVSLSDQKIDVVDPSLSLDETHLIFRNKIDGYLWMLRIVE